MGKLLDEYVPIAQRDLSTRQTNEGFIQRTIKPAIGHLKIRQVNGEVLDKFDPADARPAWKQVAPTVEGLATLPAVPVLVGARVDLPGAGLHVVESHVFHPGGCSRGVCT
jgi:hypothetical protein